MILRQGGASKKRDSTRSVDLGDNARQSEANGSETSWQNPHSSRKERG